MNAHRNALAALVLASTLSIASTARSGDTEWNTEIGFLAGYHDNYFYRDSDGSTPDETFLTVYGKGEVEFEAGPGDLGLFAGASGAFGIDLPRTDFQTADAGIKYKLNRTRVTLAYTRIQDKVFGEEDDASLFDVDNGRIRIRQQLTDSFFAEAGFGVANWDFERADNDRDALKYDVKAMLRWQVLERLALRTAFLWTTKDADSGKYDYDGPGFSVAAEIRPADPVNVFIRYRRRWRDYDNAAVGDSNYQRDDTIDDVTMNTRWQLLDFFGLQLGGTYRHGDSDRSDRNYDAFSVTGGFFVTFGNENDG